MILKRSHRIILLTVFIVFTGLTVYVLGDVLTSSLNPGLQLLCVCVAVSLISLCVMEYARLSRLHRQLEKLRATLSLSQSKSLSEAEFFDQMASLSVFPSNMQQRVFSESLQKEAEMISYQSQINPHFLYNTLDTIRSKAIIEKDYVVADMLQTLSLIFRYRISGQTFTTIGDELNNAENYLKIQQFRFGNRFTVETQVDDPEQTLNILIPRLTLQPIVENSIHHGLEPLPEGGNMKIHIYPSGQQRLIIRVEDNGVGIEPDKLKALNLKLVQSSIVRNNGSTGGIALININARLKLCFGPESGIAVYSARDKGTTIEIVICNYHKNEES